MSEGYQFDYTAGAKRQIQDVAAIARETGKLQQFVAIMKQAVHLMQTEPNVWGDPEYRSKYVDGLFCHGLIRPVTFRYVIYEQVRGVVLLSVKLYANFQ